MPTTEPSQTPMNSEMQRFKDLVFSEEHHALSDLEGRIDEVSAASYLGAQLPRALAESHSRASKELGASLRGPLVDAVKESAGEDRKVLSSALSPLIGPAIGLYVGDLFRGTAGRMNKAIRSAISIRQIRWRIEAKMNRQSYADYVALKTEKYEVDQILLIDAESAKLLHQVAWVTDKPLNTDIGADMLGAIHDYVKASLDNESLDGLEEKKVDEPGQLSFGKHHISVEAGTGKILAAVGSGNAPKRFREEMLKVIETAQSDRPKPSEPSLESLLVDNRSPGSANDNDNDNPWPFRIVAGTLVMASLGFMAFNWSSERSWQQHLDQLRATPGIEVIQESRSLLNSKSLQLLQDPLARDASEILSDQGEEVEKIALQASLFHSGESALVSLRESGLKEELSTLATRQDHLALSEIVDASHTEQHATMSAAIQLIDHLTEELFYERFDPDREKITVQHDENGWKISGTVTYHQLELLREMADDGRLFSGRPVDFTALNDDTDERLLALKREIDAIAIHFQTGTAKVSSEGKGDRVKLYKLIDQFESLHKAAEREAPKYVISASTITGVETESHPEIAFDRIESELNQLRLFEYRTARITTAPELDSETGRKGVWLIAEPTLAKD